MVMSGDVDGDDDNTQGSFRETCIREKPESGGAGSANGGSQSRNDPSCENVDALVRTSGDSNLNSTKMPDNSPPSPPTQWSHQAYATPHGIATDPTTNNNNNMTCGYLQDRSQPLLIRPPPPHQTFLSRGKQLRQVDCNAMDMAMMAAGHQQNQNLSSATSDPSLPSSRHQMERRPYLPSRFPQYIPRTQNGDHLVGYVLRRMPVPSWQQQPRPMFRPRPSSDFAAMSGNWREQPTVTPGGDIAGPNEDGTNSRSDSYSSQTGARPKQYSCNSGMSMTTSPISPGRSINNEQPSSSVGAAAGPDPLDGQNEARGRRQFLQISGFDHRFPSTNTQASDSRMRPRVPTAIVCHRLPTWTVENKYCTSRQSQQLTPQISTRTREHQAQHTSRARSTNTNQHNAKQHQQQQPQQLRDLRNKHGRHKSGQRGQDESIWLLHVEPDECITFADDCYLPDGSRVGCAWIRNISESLVTCRLQITGYGRGKWSFLNTELPTIDYKIIQPGKQIITTVLLPTGKTIGKTDRLQIDAMPVKKDIPASQLQKKWHSVKSRDYEAWELDFIDMCKKNFSFNGGDAKALGKHLASALAEGDGVSIEAELLKPEVQQELQRARELLGLHVLYGGRKPPPESQDTCSQIKLSGGQTTTGNSTDDAEQRIVRRQEEDESQIRKRKVWSESKCSGTRRLPGTAYYNNSHEEYEKIKRRKVWSEPRWETECRAASAETLFPNYKATDQSVSYSSQFAAQPAPVSTSPEIAFLGESMLEKVNARATEIGSEPSLCNPRTTLPRAYDRQGQIPEATNASQELEQQNKKMNGDSIPLRSHHSSMTSWIA